MKRVCVFLGSNHGNRPAYRVAAEELAAALTERGLGLVYGGAKVGLMGVLADAVLARGGHVIGVIPGFLGGTERAHRGLPDLRVVGSMHERKATMADLADGFIALPGGVGTFEEIFEVYTWVQLGLHAKPCALLNIAGYYDGMAQQLDHAVAEGFVKEVHRGMLLIDRDPEALLDRMAAYTPAHVPKWLNEDET